MLVSGVLVLDITTVFGTPANKAELKAIVNTFVVATIVVPVAVQVLGQVNPANVITSLPLIGTVT